MKLRYIWMQNVSFQDEKERMYLEYILNTCGTIEKFQAIINIAYKKGNYFCSEYALAAKIDKDAREYARIKPAERLYVHIY